jgi:hypothetical protein
MESVMRYKTRTALAFCGIVATAVVAVSLAFVSGGRAASPNICAPAGCVKETLAPHTLAAGSTGLSVTKFTNGSGSGGATASHTAIKVFFSPAITTTPGLISLVVNGVLQSTNTCTPATTDLTLDPEAVGSGTTVTCPDFGGTVGGSFDRVIVRYSSLAGTVKVNAKVTYGESGSDNQGGPNGTVNDRQVSNVDQATVIATTTSPTLKSECSSNNTIAGGDATLNTKFSYTSSADTVLPCTPVSAGVLATGGVNTHVALIDFPELASTFGAASCPTSGGVAFCYGVATLDFFVVPKNENAKNFVLYESLPPLFDFLNPIIVPPCGTNGLPPNPATTPAAAVTGGASQMNDTCIFSRSGLPKAGVELVLHALASPFDGHFSG